MVTLTAMALVAALQNPGDTLLVDVGWLAAHYRDPSVVIFHIGPQADYDSAHVPGAQYLTFADFAQRQSADGRSSLALPDPAWLDSVLESRGISDDSRIILYSSSQWLSPSTRAYFTLAWIGLGSRTSILNGGLPAWRAAGHPVTVERPSARPRGHFTPRPNPDLVAEPEQVLAQVNHPTATIVDARGRPFYTGERQGTGTRLGHIPGAVNVPFGDVADDSTGLFLTPDALRRLFTEAGAPGDRPIIAYCHVGQQATAIWFGARLAGLRAQLYDGSFEDWTQHESWPTITGTAPR